MLISYYANKNSSPRLPSWQPSLIFFNTPKDSGSIIKPCTVKHFQVPILAPGLMSFWYFIELVTQFESFLTYECYTFDIMGANCWNFVWYYSIRVPGWVLKCLNLITAPGSVSNQPSSVTWLATAGISKIHAVSWKNHIENQTTKGAQNM